VSYVSTRAKKASGNAIAYAMKAASSPYRVSNSVSPNGPPLPCSIARKTYIVSLRVAELVAVLEHHVQEVLAVQRSHLDVIQRRVRLHERVRVRAHDGDLVQLAGQHVAGAREAGHVRVPGGAQPAIRTLRTTQSELQQLLVGARRLLEARGVGGDEAGEVEQVEQRRLQQLAHGQAAFDAHQRDAREDDGAFLDGVDLDAGAVQRREPVEEAVLGVGQHLAQVRDVAGRELERVDHGQRLLQAGEHRVLAVERVLAEEEVEHGVVVVAPHLPVRVDPGEQVEYWGLGACTGRTGATTRPYMVIWYRSVSMGPTSELVGSRTLPFIMVADGGGGRELIGD
jgi:hypothetical protein